MKTKKTENEENKIDTKNNMKKRRIFYQTEQTMRQRHAGNQSQDEERKNIGNNKD